MRFRFSAKGLLKPGPQNGVREPRIYALLRSSRTLCGLAFIALAAVFAFCAIPAYRGYFSGDDLENLSWTSVSSISVFAQGLADPRLSPNNFRPMGHLFFWAIGRVAGGEFWPFLLAFQALHALNAVLLFRLLKPLTSDAPAVAATALFLFHHSLNGAFTMPMYVFDVLCGTFVLLSLLCYRSGRWLLSLGFFWLAYKSKEVAIGLPIVLLMIEWLEANPFGSRRWLRLLPFFAISLSFGVQALFANRPVDDYSLRFTWEALSKCALFYGREAGWVLLAIVVAAILSRSFKAAFGAAAALVLLAPMLALPGRLFAMYLYVPLIGIAAGVAGALAALAPRRRLAFGAAAALVLSLDLHPATPALLAQAAERRAFVASLKRYIDANPDALRLVCEGAPSSLESWGVEGSAKWISGWRVEARVAPREEGWRTIFWNRHTREFEETARPHEIIGK